MIGFHRLGNKEGKGWNRDTKGTRTGVGSDSVGEEAESVDFSSWVEEGSGSSWMLSSF